MITNFNTNKRKDDIKLLTMLIVVFLFVVWLCTPPGNKFMQICFWGNNTQFFIAKLTNPDSVTEWVFHRNNAVYLARMEDKRSALREMDKAVQTMPSYASERELSKLYKDRAQLRLFYNDYKGALDDYLRVTTGLDLTDKFKIALLYKMNGNNKYALSFCNEILDVDSTAYAGYACVADVYDGVGRPDVAVKVYDLLIDRVSNRAKYYADRAMYKQKCGDVDGYNADMNKAKELLPTIDTKSSIIEETISPKKLTLQIL